MLPGFVTSLSVSLISKWLQQRVLFPPQHRPPPLRTGLWASKLGSVQWALFPDMINELYMFCISAIPNSLSSGCSDSKIGLVNSPAIF